MAHNGISAAQLEREIEAQRTQLESTIGAIKGRLTPGRMVDEFMSYSRQGGGQFATNLRHTAMANPLATTLLGASLAWLMMGPKHKPDGSAVEESGSDRYHEYGNALSYGTIHSGGLQRVSHTLDDRGVWHSEFIDDSGKKYRAQATELGERAGHFTDETGKKLTGFVDAAGKRIEEFRDEAGNLLDNALGWASHTWRDATDAGSSMMDSAKSLAGDARSNATHLARDVQSNVAHFARDMQNNAAQISRTAMHMFEEQPLVAAALAFAAGAAIGAALPATRQEDEAIGQVADDVKRQAASVAGDLYEKGRETAAGIYEDAAAKAGEVYTDAEHKLEGETPIIRH